MKARNLLRLVLALIELAIRLARLIEDIDWPGLINNYGERMSGRPIPDQVSIAERYVGIRAHT